MCSRRCANPAAKQNCILSAPAARLAPIVLICCPREFRAAPLAQHGGGICAIVLIVFSNVNTHINAVSCFPRRCRGIIILPSSSDDGGVRLDNSNEEDEEETEDEIEDTVSQGTLGTFDSGDFLMPGGLS